MQPLVSDLELFVAVAEGANLAQAALRMSITPAAASAAMKRLEAQLGAKLLLRTTRKLRLTQDGERYLPHARKVLHALDSGRSALRGDGSALSGLVRLSAPADMGRNRLLQLLRRFSDRLPQVRFQLLLDDAVGDFYAEPMDLALRYGQLDDSRLIAVPLAELQRVAVASPAYLSEFGEPEHPDQLREHSTICYMLHRRAATRWRFVRDGQTREVEVQPRWVFNDAEVVRRCAAQGMGIAYRIQSDLQEDIDAGRLQPILTEWQGSRISLNLVYPDRQLSPLLRNVVDHLIDARHVW